MRRKRKLSSKRFARIKASHPPSRILLIANSSNPIIPARLTHHTLTTLTTPSLRKKRRRKKRAKEEEKNVALEIGYPPPPPSSLHFGCENPTGMLPWGGFCFPFLRGAVISTRNPCQAAVQLLSFLTIHYEARKKQFASLIPSLSLSLSLFLFFCLVSSPSSLPAIRSMMSRQNKPSWHAPPHVSSSRSPLFRTLFPRFKDEQWPVYL
ncbi:hypothetical protein V8C35DRAFT_313253 [Trichoderma chlorosporum]